LIVIVLEYGANFSGPGKDVFRLDRATGEAEHAHMSNFLHPVLYYYETLPTGRPRRASRNHNLEVGMLETVV